MTEVYYGTDRTPIIQMEQQWGGHSPIVGCNAAIAAGRGWMAKRFQASVKAD